MDLSAFGIRTVSHETYPKTPRSSSLVERAPEHPARSEYRKPVHDSSGAHIGDQLPLVTPHEANYGYEMDPAMIWTSEGHQGKGLARAMFRFGQAMQGGNFVHSIERTPEGAGYSARVPDDPDQDPARIVPTTRTDHFHQGSLF